jgi:hypothetical protein
MWKQLTPADIERVKHRLAVSRAETLSRHAEELKALDAQQDEVESLERLLTTFAQKYLAASSPIVSALEQSTPMVEPIAVGFSDLEVQQKAVSVGLQVRQQVSPNFEAPPRLRRFMGG